MNARDYLMLLRERKLVIASSLLVCILLALAVTAITPKSYTSSMTFYVVADGAVAGQPTTPSDVFAGAQTAQTRVKSYTELVAGPGVARGAAEALNDGTSDSAVMASLLVESTEDTVLISVSVRGSTPQRALDTATAVSSAFRSLVEDLETGSGDAEPLVGVAVVQEPTLPGAPTTPVPSLNLAIGGLLGLLIGFGLAVARRSMDVTIRTAEQLETATDAAVLGVVPEVPASDGELIAFPGTGRGATSPRAEVFRRIRTNLEFANVDGNRQVLVITSALPGEGKSTVTCNLAASLAAVGARVVLVEADLRRPTASASLGLDRTVGLTTVLTGKVELHQALQTCTPGAFDVLASGRTPPRPNELLSSRRTGAVIEELRRRYDFVLVDAPPLLPVADAVNLGTHADGAIVVCRWGKTDRTHVSSALAFLRAVSIPVVGAILFRAPRRAGAVWTYHGAYLAEPMDEAPAAPEPRQAGAPGAPPSRSGVDPQTTALALSADRSGAKDRTASDEIVRAGHNGRSLHGPSRPTPRPRPEAGG